MADSAALSKRLRRRRKALGLSQKRLSLAAGITTNTVARIEQGEHRPGHADLEQLAEALGMNPAALVGEEDGNAH